jgi:prolyl-tRNA synthetase
MKLSHLFTKTRREAPRDETAKNAQLLIRAGFIYKEMAGVYSFLPLGLRVLRNIETIVREEMDAIGGQELQLTSLQEKAVWEASGRWSDSVMDVWFKTKLQSGTEIGLAATHEEPLTRIVASYINSYKDLPFSAYQFQWKLRNELRAKSGIMRGREFRMKDLYSFAATQEQHDEFYAAAQKAYTKVYDRLGISKATYFTYASGGSFSKFSHEYQTVLAVGEDTIYVDDDKRVAINEEVINDPDVLKEIGTTKGKLRKVAAAEVGNIFPLGTKYSEALGAKFTDEEGNEHPVIMGSYGIGVSRLIGVLAEYFADDKGLVWPAAVAPAQVHLVRLGTDAAVVKAAEKLYADLQKHQIEVLYDDRDESAGAKFADADLIGCPTRLTISGRTLETDSVELKQRDQEASAIVSLAEAVSKLK